MNLNMSVSLAPIVALIAGLLILVVPRLLNYIVAIYLIITGLLGLFPHLRYLFTRAPRAPLRSGCRDRCRHPSPPARQSRRCCRS